MLLQFLVDWLFGIYFLNIFCCNLGKKCLLSEVLEKSGIGGEFENGIRVATLHCQYDSNIPFLTAAEFVWKKIWIKWLCKLASLSTQKVPEKTKNI